MTRKQSSIYDPQFVGSMFDRMSSTYGVANYITSFGFTERWRWQCMANLPVVPANARGLDLMSGMGELWGEILRKTGKGTAITAVDISTQMHRKASKNLQQFGQGNIHLLQADALNSGLPSASADFVVSSFGLKTFDSAQQRRLATEVHRLLKQGGVFSFVEISEPEVVLLKWPFMFYLKVLIPLIGKVFLGNAEDYRMLGRYCAAFRNCRPFFGFLRETGLEVHYKNHFYGCATAVCGTKKGSAP